MAWLNADYPEDDFKSTSGRVVSWTSLSNVFLLRHPKSFESKLSETARELQEIQPTFVPKFNSLRKVCLEHTVGRLREIENNLEDIQDGDERSKMLDEAVLLLKQLGEIGRAFLFSR